MPHLEAKTLPDGRRVWVGRSGEIVAPLRSGDSHEDEKDHVERRYATALALHLGLDPQGLDRPVSGTHDFDLRSDDACVVLSVEIKGLTWPSTAMRSLHQTNEAIFSVSDFEDEIRRDLRKASRQLSSAAGARRAILIVWSYDDWPSSPGGADVQRGIERIAAGLRDASEVWITTPRAFTFERVR